MATGGCSHCAKANERIAALEKELIAWRQIDKMREAVIKLIDPVGFNDDPL